MENRFDKIAVAIAGGASSRRNALKWLSGLLPATLFAGVLGERKVLAASINSNNNDNNNGNGSVKQRCHNFCKDVLAHQQDQCEDACENCKGNVSGLCGSPGSFVCCSTATVCCHGVNACGTPVAVCTNTGMDPNNCGTCGNVCVGGTCVNGHCVPNCAPPLTTCAGICTDTSKDVNNCGSCGKVCVGGQLCTSGVCTCVGGTTLCYNSSTGVPACVDLKSDQQNCGTCGNVCAAGTTCTKGVCGSSCPSGQTMCSGACVDLQSDSVNCGTCGTVCPPGQLCVRGACVLGGCPANQVRCGSNTLCCPGTACCGASCPTAHSNGVGQTYYDCNPVGTHTQTSAFEACNAAMPIYGGTCTTASCGSDTIVLLQSATSCYVWAYTGPNAGHVSTSPGTTCLCPMTADPAWG